MRLWGRTTSINVQKVIWALEELQVKYDRVDAGGAFGKLDTDEFLAMNPNGKIPVLEDGDLVIYESHSIIRHICRNQDGGRLYQTNHKELAIADQWIDWAETELLPTYYEILGAILRTPPSKQDPAKIKALAEKLGRIYGLVDKRLSSSPYLGGKVFSAADIPVGTTLYRYFTVPISRPSLPALESWYATLQERKAYRDFVMVDYSVLQAKDS